MASVVDHFARASLRARGYRSIRVPTSVGRMHVLDARGQGSLPPVVLLHGLTSAGVHFTPLLHRLRPDVSRLIIPDMPGHGFSELPENGFDPEVLRRGLFEALDHVIDEPALIFGNSLGGYAAIRYALERPDRVRGLVLASPAGATMTPDEMQSMRQTFRIEQHADALSFIDRLFAKRLRSRQIFAWGLRRQFRRMQVDRWMDAIADAELLRAEHLNAIVQPTLLIWGRAERILPARHLAFFREHLPSHARIEEPQHFGHSPFLDDARALAVRMLAFGADVSGHTLRTTRDRHALPRTA